ncbi:hypothetical protein GTP23_12795 [Pseudoduganella sp. FT93W]|uniref:Phage conserved hypothetical protein C-terminal domain-containing protein n=1 Tax=Duganella fentianensis TaxID=2692177 RepID=A0A845I3S3_9BURK|nr:conserved phage C-terminal domain-containing protein [Duganella fentianensis]MYN45926.1 hypothetical protein [Duganella fentianensis]
MARIRTIKPEFWTSEQIAECSPTSRLLFIGIWNFCDDHGIHPASIKRLKMEVFPSDPIADADIQSMVSELEAAGLIQVYEIEGKQYWLVTGWARHQKIEKPTYRHPLPTDHLSPLFKVKGANSPTTPRIFADKSAPPRLRNGMESKGVNSMSGNPDEIDVLNYLNDKAGKAYRTVKSNLSLIGARLKEGATVEDCKAVIDAKVASWAGDEKMREYLRPQTLFGAAKFAGYVGQLGNTSSAAVKDWE